MVRLSRKAIALAFLALILPMVQVSVGATRARTADVLSSPEEIAVQLHSYLLRGDEVPAGYTVGALATWTPATLAFYDTSGSAPADALARIKDEGLLLEARQTIVPAADLQAAGDNGAYVYFEVFDTAAHAREFADGSTIAFDPEMQETVVVPDAPSYGDGGTTWHLVESHPDGSVTAGYVVRWTRGVLRLEVITSTSPSREEISLGDAFALATDNHAATQTPIQIGPPILQAPANQLARLQALLRMQSIGVPAPSLPSGYVQRSQQASTIASSVLSAENPTAVLSLLDEKFQRLATLATFYGTPSQTVPFLAVTISEDLTVDSAYFDMHDVDPLSESQDVVTNSPLQLGDDSLMVDAVHLDGRGNPFESLSIVFRHESLTIGVYMNGPAGTPNLRTVEAMAQAVDAAYWQSAYAP